MDDEYTVEFEHIPLCKYSMWVVIDEWDNKDFVCRKHNCYCCANYRCEDYEPKKGENK